MSVSYSAMSEDDEQASKINSNPDGRVFLKPKPKGWGKE